MELKIEDSNRFGALSPERLDAFEKELGVRLPEPYRRFLQAHNGGYVEGARDIQALSHVYGLHDGPSWAQFLDRRRAYGLLEQGLAVNYTDPENGFTSLMMAASGGAIDIARFLVALGADRSPRNRWGKTAADLAHQPEMKDLLG